MKKLQKIMYLQVAARLAALRLRSKYLFLICIIQNLALYLQIGGKKIREVDSFLYLTKFL